MSFNISSQYPFSMLVEGAALAELEVPLRVTLPPDISLETHWKHSPKEFADIIANARLGTPDIKKSAPIDIAHAIRMITSIGDRYLLSSDAERQELREAFQPHKQGIIDQYSRQISAWSSLVSDLQKETLPGFTQFGLKTIEILLQGKRFRPCLDVTDSLGIITADKNIPFAGVPEALAALLQTGRLDLLSGDALSNIIEGFLMPAGLHPNPERNFFETKLLGNLYLKGRYGLDAMEYTHGDADFTLSSEQMQGIPESAYQLLQQKWVALCEEHKISDRFEGRLQAQVGKSFGYEESHGNPAEDNISVMFFMVGKLVADSRALFKSHPDFHEDRLLMKELARQMNEFCEENINPYLPEGAPKVVVETEGVSTIAARTADKGILMEALRSDASPHEVFLFGGDNVFFGNDGPGAKASDLAVQIGHEEMLVREQFDSFPTPCFSAAREGSGQIADFLMHIARLNAAFEVLFPELNQN